MLDWMGFPSVRNMTDGERDANDERVRLAADRVRIVSPPVRSILGFKIRIDPNLAGTGKWYLLGSDGKRHYPPGDESEGK